MMGNASIELDILLLTVYFICVGYVLYQMALSVDADLEDQVSLIPDGDLLAQSVAEQLTRQGIDPSLGELLQAAPAPLKSVMALKLTVPAPKRPNQENPDPDGSVIVQVLPQGAQPVQPLTGLTVQVLNQTQSVQALVDWDRSSFTLTTNQAQRVIRHTPGMRMDLALAQVVSVVNPNQLLSTGVTGEPCFGRDPATQVLQIAAPLVEVNGLLKQAPGDRVYALNLVVQLAALTGRGLRPIVLLLPFRFRVERLAARASIPYVNWLLRR